MRDQWNTCVPMGLINTHFLKVHNFTLHPKPIIPIFSEIFFKLPTYPEKRFELSTLNLRQTEKSLNDCKLFYFDASKMKNMLNFVSDRHRFFLLTDDHVVNKYNIQNHIAREYGHQLGSSLYVSTIPMFHGSRTSVAAWRWRHMKINGHR